MVYVRSTTDADDLWRRIQLAKSILGSQRAKTGAEKEALMALDGATIQQITDSRKEEKPHVVQGR